MNDIAIKIENLSKQYRLGNIGTGTLTQDLQRWWAKSRGKEDPTLQIGMENKLAELGGDYVYALNDINLEVKQGDILGVIGKNGAGKSTLLKILSRVTTPTTGTVDMYGRVASLLEVGTGFHPELTGRENIFLNGAIMGMTKQEIKSKFDEIVDFSGVEKYIDTPVKRYSSGMYVRLAFAVAAYLESEILIVDEVLAVGDAAFQKKAIGKMQDISSKDSRTVLFVSHNMGAVSRLCNTGLLLKNGTVCKSGKINAVIDEYLQGDSDSVGLYQAIDNNEKETQVISAKIFDGQGRITDSFSNTDDIQFDIVIKNHSKEKEIRCNVGVSDMYDNLIMIDRLKIDFSDKYITFKGILRGNVLLPNRYKISISIDIPNIRVIEILSKTINFEIVDTIGIDVAKSGDYLNGMIKSYFEWEKI